MTGNKETQKQLHKQVTEKLLKAKENEKDAYLKKLNNYNEFANLPEDKLVFKIETGLITENIIGTVNKLKPDLFLLASDIKEDEDYLNINIETIVKNINVPILLLPQTYNAKKIVSNLNIAYLAVFDESDLISISYLYKQAKLLGFNLHCVQIANKKTRLDELKVLGLKQYYKNVYDIETVIHPIEINDVNINQTLDQYFSEAKVDIISFSLKKEDIFNNILYSGIKSDFHFKLPFLLFKV